MISEKIVHQTQLLNLQMAAEAMFEGQDGAERTYAGKWQTQDLLREALIKGNFHASHFTDKQADDFVSRYKVVAHQPNTANGFSATAFEALEDDPVAGIKKGEIFISVRSTEFIDDHLRDSAGTNKTIKEHGWAFGQIADMQDWYNHLIGPGGELENNPPVAMTGYSLGGHVVTAFALLQKELGLSTPPITTFNGAGTGEIKQGYSLQSALQVYRDTIALESLPFTPDQAKGWRMLESDLWDTLTIEQKAAAKAHEEWETLLQRQKDIAALSPGVRQPDTADVSTGINFLDFKTFYAINLAGLQTGGAGIFANAWPITPKVDNVIDNLTELYGAGVTFVASSGVHHSNDRQEVYIEDQPLRRGNYLKDPLDVLFELVEGWDVNAGGDTHSLVLMQDSMALMDVMMRADSSLDYAACVQIFRAATASIASSLILTQGKAEGDSLEAILDALCKLAGVKTDGGEDFNLHNAAGINDGNTWAEDTYRIPYHDALSKLRTAWAGKSLSIRPTADQDSASLANQALADNDSGTAYRYALLALNPFVVVGDIYQNYAAQLELYNEKKGTLSSLDTERVHYALANYPTTLQNLNSQEEMWGGIVLM